MSDSLMHKTNKLITLFINNDNIYGFYCFFSVSTSLSLSFCFFVVLHTINGSNDDHQNSLDHSILSSKKDSKKRVVCFVHLSLTQKRAAREIIARARAPKRHTPKFGILAYFNLLLCDGQALAFTSTKGLRVTVGAYQDLPV